ncbi:serpin family protein [Microbacterium rhizophilus]|uniref:serpin family protein n=1 Tax=Microbacterium rhizophilus TaxID=3138934 RepID=UPI0031EAA4FD
MTLHRVIGGCAALALIISIASCASPGPVVLRAEGVTAQTVGLADAPALDDVVDAARTLGVATLGLSDEDENVVLSPGSLATALAMLAEGARGESLAELEAVLGAAGPERAEAFAALRGALALLDGDPAAATADELPERPILHVADQVVIDDGVGVRDEFLESLTGTFDAGVQHTDLSTEQGLAPLHEWVREHTGGLIEKSAIEPDPLLKAVLQDAVLLAARWKTPFGPASDESFTLADGTVVRTATMGALEKEFAHAEVDGWAAVRLPYTEALHADVLLPPEGQDPAAATADVLADLDSALDAAVPGPIHLTLPTLDIESETDLLSMLPGLGLATLPECSGAADLSGIAGDPGDLCVGQAKQQAVLQVDEAGTVAAAVTELGVVQLSMPHVEAEFLFDRPFLFTVSHDQTDWPLFLAAIRDPRH